MKNKVYLLFFTTGSCAEYQFKPLRNYFQNIFMKLAEKKLISLTAQTCLMLFKKNTHIVAQYFDLITQSYFKNVMSPAFGVSAYWHNKKVHGYGTLVWPLLEI
jgi:hypothetical protein